MSDEEGRVMFSDSWLYRRNIVGTPPGTEETSL